MYIHVGSHTWDTYVHLPGHKHILHTVSTYASMYTCICMCKYAFSMFTF